MSLDKWPPQQKAASKTKSTRKKKDTFPYTKETVKRNQNLGLLLGQMFKEEGF